jgi:hypothetical protein
MQRALTKQLEAAGERDALDAAFRALPAEDPRREAWMSTDSFSSQWISTSPSKRDALSAAEFGEVFTTYLGVERPPRRACSSTVPSRPPALGPSASVTRMAITSALRSHADGPTPTADGHDAIAARVLGDVLRAGIQGNT